MNNEEWVSALQGDSERRTQAIAELRSVLIRGLKAGLGGWARSVGSEFSTIIDDFAQEAVIRVLDNLLTFRSESRFTTWAVKIAIRIALTEFRKKKWQNYSLDHLIESGGMPMGIIRAPRRLSDPAHYAERADAMQMIQEMIRDELTERQRIAMNAVGMEGIPLEEVARRMGTNRNSLYKLIHDARRKLKAAIERRGTSIPEMMSLFEKD